MKNYNEKTRDIIFESLISNINSEIQGAFKRDRWIDVEAHFFSTDGGKNLSLERDGEYICYIISEENLIIEIFAEIYGFHKINFEKNKEGFLSFEKAFREFNQNFFKDWHSFVRRWYLKL